MLCGIRVEVGRAGERKGRRRRLLDGGAREEHERGPPRRGEQGKQGQDEPPCVCLGFGPRMEQARRKREAGDEDSTRCSRPWRFSSVAALAGVTSGLTALRVTRRTASAAAGQARHARERRRGRRGQRQRAGGEAAASSKRPSFDATASHGQPWRLTPSLIAPISDGLSAGRLR